MPLGNYPQGPFILVCGSDGTNPIVAHTDADGDLQVDVLTLGGIDALALEATLQAVRDRIGALTAPAAGSVNKQLADMLAKLDVALSTRALEAGGNLAAAVTALQLIDDFALGTNKLFGYNNRYAERIFTLDAVAGTNYLYGTAVPAGEIWCVQAVRGVDATSAITNLEIRVQGGGITALLQQVLNPVVNKSLYWTGAIIVKEGDWVVGRFDGCTVGDDLYLDIWGYKMKVA